MTWVDDWRADVMAWIGAGAVDLATGEVYPVKASHVAVLLDLSRFADYRDGSRIRPGHGRVAAECRVSVKTVERAVALFVAAGWLEVEVPAAPGRAAEYHAQRPSWVSGVGPGGALPRNAPAKPTSLTGVAERPSPVSTQQPIDQPIANQPPIPEVIDQPQDAHADETRTDERITA